MSPGAVQRLLATCLLFVDKSRYPFHTAVLALRASQVCVLNCDDVAWRGTLAQQVAHAAAVHAFGAHQCELCEAVVSVVTRCASADPVQLPMHVRTKAAA